MPDLPDWDRTANKIYFIDPQELEIRHTQFGNVVHMRYDLDGADQEQINTMINTRNIIYNNNNRLAEIQVRIPVFHRRHFLMYRFVECSVVEFNNNLDNPTVQMLGDPHHLYHMRVELGFNCIYHDYRHSPVSMETASGNIPGLPQEYRQYRLEGEIRRRLG